jgi:hypothetical protein
MPIPSEKLRTDLPSNSVEVVVEHCFKNRQQTIILNRAHRTFPRKVSPNFAMNAIRPDNYWLGYTSSLSLHDSTSMRGIIRESCS